MLVSLRDRIATRRWSLAKVLGIVFLAVVISSCAGTSTTSTPTPTPATPQYTVLNLGIPQKALNAPIIGLLPNNQVLRIGISFKLNQSEIDKWNQVTKNHGKKGSNVNPSSIANQLGITDAEYQDIKEYLGISNVTLTLNKLHTYLTVDAKVSAVNELLQTRMVLHKLNGRTFYTPDPKMPPKLPTFIADHIAAITGLENYSQVHTGATNVPRLPYSTMSQHTSHRQADCNPDPQTVSIDQIASAYGYNQFWQNNFKGDGITINLVETDTFFADDISTYFSCVGFNPNNFQVINVDGQPTQVAGESMLDIEMIAGLAPNSTIKDYQAGNSSFQALNDMLQQIINDNASNANSASIVSISLGAAENGLSNDAFQALDNSFKQLTQVEHMTVFVASGDCGAFADETYGDLTVNFPASDTNVVSVGGTELSVDGSGNRAGEVVWSNGSNRSQCQNQWGSGGGLSTAFDQPSWQQGNGVSNQYSDGKRQIPDISAIADNIAFYVQGQWSNNGGTSAAAPIWAAGMALVNQALIANANGTYFYGPDTFYQVASGNGKYQPYYDVTQGNNLYYSATQGWDYATGLGTPNLVDFYNVLASAAQSGS